MGPARSMLAMRCKYARVSYWLAGHAGLQAGHVGIGQVDGGAAESSGVQVAARDGSSACGAQPHRAASSAKDKRGGDRMDDLPRGKAAG
ncbi:hypothetical protein XOCgx_3871 [Xanthomonas oryzae pv. oryzicola]|nr:hypothetical protein XOCgx_3871 [Xanthomonas oryzae pv. oryzicola]